MATPRSIRHLVALGVLAACSGSKPPAPPHSKIQTVAWNAPGITRASSGPEAKFVARDGPVAASFSGEGIALSHATQGSGLRWTLDGARIVQPKPSAPLPGRVNDLRGDPADWKTEQTTYGRMEYAGVYPGVTLTIETRRHGVAYRFDVAAGADPRLIRMRYAGAAGVAIEEEGKSLSVRWGQASIRERGLRCFQEIGGKEMDVPCRYATSEKDPLVVALEVGPYDRSHPLIIDPEILWGSYLGGNSTDSPRAVAVDASGNVYVTGNTYSANFPTPSGYDKIFGGDTDAFLTKIGPMGDTVAWSTYLGGANSDYGYGVGVDASGDAFVTGYTTSADFPTTGGFDTTLDGFSESFIAKFGVGGTLTWSSYLGGSSDEYAYALAMDSAGDAYVTGYTFSFDFPTPGGFDTTLDGGMEVFVTRIASAGTIVWSTYLGGNSSDYAYGIAVDGADDVYVDGYTYSTDFPTFGGFDTTLEGGEDAFVAKIANGPTPSVVWGSFLGGTSSDYAQAIAVDGAGNAYLTGYTYSTDFPSMGGFDTALGSFQDAFVTKVDAAGGSLAWSSYIGGETSSDYGQGVVADATGGVYVFGYTFSNDFPVVGGFDMGYSNGDAYVMRVDASGALDWSSFLGGGSTEYGYAMARGPNDNPVVVGETYSTDFPATGGFDLTQSGGSDAYVVRIVVCGNAVCESGEDECNCAQDCGDDTCGNGCCGPAENTGNCEPDCPDLCGNTFCGAEESACTCPEDCGDDTCGNGCCGEAETECTCAQDCDDVCGDGCCTGGENPCGCPSDCSGAGECGNGCRDPGETACNCPEDTLDLCGDGCCTGDETCTSCARDCGACTEMVPDGGGGGGDSGGCGCHLASRPPSWGVAALLALLATAWRRRRA